MNPFKKIAQIVSKPILAPINLAKETDTLVEIDKAGINVLEAAKPLAKSWHQSKTVWFNIIVALLALVHIHGIPIPPQVILYVTAVGNIILRIMTVGPLKTMIWLAQFASSEDVPPPSDVKE